MTGAFARAIPLLEEIRHINGDVPGVWYLLASCYLQTGKNKEATACLSRAAEIDPELFADFSILLPEELMKPSMKRLFARKKK